jgi:hypothetical protein
MMVKAISAAIRAAVSRRFGCLDSNVRSGTGRAANAPMEDDDWDAIRRDLEDAYGGPLELDGEDLHMLRAIFAEAKKIYGPRSEAMRSRELMT